MKKLLLICMITSLLNSCAGPQSQNFMTPSGNKGAQIDCVSDKTECFQKASETCGNNSYQVIDSWSNAGGSYKDWMPGPFTWYHMQIMCGPSDGRMPEFRFKGQEYVPPKGPTVTKCKDSGGNTITCKTY
mgnify:FL=1